MFNLKISTIKKLETFCKYMRSIEKHVSLEISNSSGNFSFFFLIFLEGRKM